MYKKILLAAILLCGINANAAVEHGECDISNPSFCLPDLNTQEFKVELHNSSKRYIGFDILGNNNYGLNLVNVLNDLEITLENTNLKVSASRFTISVRGENGGLLPPLFIVAVTIKSKTSETIQEILDRNSRENVSLAIVPVSATK